MAQTLKHLPIADASLCHALQRVNQEDHASTGLRLASNVPLKRHVRRVSESSCDTHENDGFWRGWFYI